MMAGNIWRGIVAITDWRTGLRKISNSPAIDAVFISNMRDHVDRRRFLGSFRPSSGHINGPRYWINGTAGRTRAINMTTDELTSNEGREKAKEQFLSATAWARDNGARVVLLAASTKRLFGPEGHELKSRFPEMIFTIGDNGTAYLLREETMRALSLSGLLPGSARVAVLGPYGLLGEAMVNDLMSAGYEVVGGGTNRKGLDRIRDTYKIRTYKSIIEMCRVDAVVACTHGDKIRLTAENIEFIRPKGKKFLVVDVAEPSNLRYREHEKCRHLVVRQDAGNAYAPGLKYVLGALSYRMFRLTRGVTFGCFAEALAIASSISNGNGSLRKVDWFKVNQKNMTMVAEMFHENGFTMPDPRCFGKPVRSFDLAIS